MKALTSGRIIGWALENFSATSTSQDGMIEVYVKPQDWVAPDSVAGELANLTLDDLATSSSDTHEGGSTPSFTDRFFASIFARITRWFASASNGITDLFASRGHFNDELCVGNTCVTPAQFQALVAASATPAPNSPATTTTPSSASLTLNGNSPAQWPLNTTWQDNLGVLFAHDGISEIIYSTSTIDTSVSGTTTIEYWAQVPTSQEWLKATRDVVISAPIASSSSAGML